MLMRKLLGTIDEKKSEIRNSKTKFKNVREFGIDAFELLIDGIIISLPLLLLKTSIDNHKLINSVSNTTYFVIKEQ